jgi:hypothetical protein
MCRGHASTCSIEEFLPLACPWLIPSGPQDVLSPGTSGSCAEETIRCVPEAGETGEDAGVGATYSRSEEAGV